MGIFTPTNNENLINLFNSNIFDLKFNENIDEATNVVLKDKNSAFTIYIRSQKEATNEHWCSIKACSGGGHSGKNKSIFIPYLVPGMDHPIHDINEVEIDKHVKDKTFDRKYGKIVRTFIMVYQKDLIDYWNAETTEQMNEIENRIRSSLAYNGFKIQ